MPEHKALCSNCQNSFCSQLSPDIRSQLCALGKFVTLKPKKEQLINLDSRKIFIIESGSLMTIRLLENDKYQGMDILRSGDILGIGELFNANDGCEMIVIRPLSQVKFCIVPLSEMERLMSCEPSFFQCIYTMLAKRYHRILSTFATYCSGNSNERLKRALELTASEPNLTHENIATLSGLNRVTVTKKLQNL